MVHTLRPLFVRMGALIPLASALLMSGALLSSCKTLGLGTPEYCGPKVRPYVQETWAPYCEKLNQHLEDPTSYKLTELTAFLAAYPLKAEEIRNEMARYKEIQKCYADGADQLTYKRLTACVADDDDMAYRASTSWKVAAEKWFEDKYTFQTKKLNRELKALAQQSQKVNREIEEKFDLKIDMDPKVYASFHDKLEEERARAKQVEEYEALFKEARAKASEYKALGSFINSEFGKQADELARIQDDNRALLKQLNTDDRYFSMASPATGRACPRSSGSARDKGVAKRLLRDQIGEIQASSNIIISGGITSREDGPAQFESFKGKICGNRGEKNQFSKRRVLCSTYTFTIERSKGVDDKRWDEWALKKFEEDDFKGSVDCKLL